MTMSLLRWAIGELFPVNESTIQLMLILHQDLWIGLGLLLGLLRKSISHFERLDDI
jgi:hypothetical protein